MATIPPLSRTHVSLGACAMGHWQSFAIFVWCARADGITAREVVAFGNQLMNSRPKFSPLHVVEETAGLPTPEGRDGLLAPAKVHQDRLGCIGVLLPEAHIAAAMMRVFVRTARVILRGQVETVVESTLDRLVSEVLAVHERRTGEHFEARDLTAAIEAVRSLSVASPAR